jgi:hypothetical protein
MAAEVLNLIGEILETNPDHPDRRILLEAAESMEKYLAARGLAEKFRVAYEELPDDTQLAELFPEPFYTGLNGKVLHGKYEEMTRDQIFSMFPQWNNLYNAASHRERAIMSHTLKGIDQTIKAGILSLGGLRAVDNQFLDHIRSSQGQESATSVVIKIGLAKRH